MTKKTDTYLFETSASDLGSDLVQSARDAVGSAIFIRSD